MLEKKPDFASERLTLVRTAFLKLIYIMANISIASLYDKVKAAVWDKQRERSMQIGS